VHAAQELIHQLDLLAFPRRGADGRCTTGERIPDAGDDTHIGRGARHHHEEVAGCCATDTARYRRVHEPDGDLCEAGGPRTHGIGTDGAHDEHNGSRLEVRHRSLEHVVDLGRGCHHDGEDVCAGGSGGDGFRGDDSRRGKAGGGIRSDVVGDNSVALRRHGSHRSAHGTQSDPSDAGHDDTRWAE
jgi:hypothetical protein